MTDKELLDLITVEEVIVLLRKLTASTLLTEREEKIVTYLRQEGLIEDYMQFTTAVDMV